MHKGIFTIIIICFTSNVIVCQNNESASKNDKVVRDAFYKEWVNNLYEFGVERKGDSIILNHEARLILKDTNYHKAIYPRMYRLEVAKAFINKKALKAGFWYLINLFQSEKINKDDILKIIIPFDRALEMDKILVATYYTYIAFDPEVYDMVDGKTSEIKRPDIAENKLRATQEIVEQIMFYRKQFDNQNVKKDN